LAVVIADPLLVPEGRGTYNDEKHAGEVNIARRSHNSEQARNKEVALFY
jgi:hypothetical protein